MRVRGRVEIPYTFAAGPSYDRFFEALRQGRITAPRCAVCGQAFLPPRPYCPFCFIPAEEWVELPDVGTVQTFTVVHLAYEGQATQPPYCYALIRLDGCATPLHHLVGGVDPDHVRIGHRVRAVWRDERTGSLADIMYFAPVADVKPATALGTWLDEEAPPYR